MTRIPLIVKTSESKQFRRIYLKKKTISRNVFHRFPNLHENSKILKKKMTLIAYVFPKLPTTKDVLR